MATQEEELRIRFSGDSAGLERSLAKLAKEQEKAAKAEEKLQSERAKSNKDRADVIKGFAAGGDAASMFGGTLEQLADKFEKLSKFGITPASVALGGFLGQMLAGKIKEAGDAVNKVNEGFEAIAKQSFRDSEKNVSQLSAELKEANAQLDKFADLRNEIASAEGAAYFSVTARLKAAAEGGFGAFFQRAKAQDQISKKEILTEKRISDIKEALTEKEDQAKREAGRQERDLLSIEQERAEAAEMRARGASDEADRYEKQKADMRELANLEGERFKAAQKRQKAENSMDSTFGKTTLQLNEERKAKRKFAREKSKFDRRKAETDGLVDVQRDINGQVISGKDPLSGERRVVPRESRLKEGEQQFQGLDRLRDLQRPQIEKPPEKPPDKPIPDAEKIRAEEAAKAAKPVVDELKGLRQDIKESTLK